MVLPKGVNISGSKTRPGDKVILFGSLGDHRIAVLNVRPGLGPRTENASTVKFSAIKSGVYLYVSASPYPCLAATVPCVIP
ncbi:MAG: hypothetical protein ABII74_06510 [Elusimicrobiota bacterium]